MRLWSACLVTVLALTLFLGGCSVKNQTSHEPTSPDQSGQAPIHAHGSPVSKLGLQPAVVDGVMEVNDVALIKDGQLVEVDLLNVVGSLHGIFAIPRESTVLITIEGKNVAWSETETDYPVKATIPGPVTRRGSRLQMSAEQLRQLMSVYFPTGKIEVKDEKLHLTTGR